MNERLWSHVRVAEGDACWEWQGWRNVQGYGKVRVGKRARRAHRVVYEDAYGPIPAGLCVLHRCDNPSCVRPDHLFLGTRVDNGADMARKGRQAKGKENGRSKLTMEQVIELRRRYRAGEGSQRALAREFGMSRSATQQALLGQTWAWLEDPEAVAL